MKHIERKDLRIFGVQAAIGAVVLLLPTLTAYLYTHSLDDTWGTLFTVWGLMKIPFFVYFANFYLLVPQLLEKRRKPMVLFLINFAIFAAASYGIFVPHPHHIDLPREAVLGYYAGLFWYFLMNAGLVFAAIIIRRQLRMSELRRQLQEEKQRNTEAELAWLKNQIHPHFLFNTLNNISSLTQIDPDKAQDSIAQLSDLLRYAMYETNKAAVPLQGELEFMQNYIELMKLRCNERTTVSVRWDASNPQTPVAPLLFISLIENAFKHGTSSNRPSEISISLTQTEHQLTFTCDNTDYAKSDGDRSGSGIGLENTRRRLELIYPNRYEWKQTATDGIYHSQLTIRLYGSS